MPTSFKASSYILHFERNKNSFRVVGRWENLFSSKSAVARVKWSAGLFMTRRSWVQIKLPPFFLLQRIIHSWFWSVSARQEKDLKMKECLYFCLCCYHRHIKELSGDSRRPKNPQEILNAKMSQVTKNLFLSLEILSILGNLVSKVQDIYFLWNLMPQLLPRKPIFNLAAKVKST